ncbi:MAG: hypothetical protein KDN22_24120 [Verrucomicrobiae bacterium]|nr:hypothetical protein [Verrucomicrobiae bacterium]
MGLRASGGNVAVGIVASRAVRIVDLPLKDRRGEIGRAYQMTNFAELAVPFDVVAYSRRVGWRDGELERGGGGLVRVPDRDTLAPVEQREAKGDLAAVVEADLFVAVAFCALAQSQVEDGAPQQGDPGTDDFN